MAMTVGQIHKLAVDMAIRTDMRGTAAVKRHLIREKDRFEKLTAREKSVYDRETLWNPYADSRVTFGDDNRVVKRVAVGIDVGVSEMLLAHELSSKTPVDLVITHHPVGMALAAIHEVVAMQAEMMAKYGVPINVAQGLLETRIDEVSRRVSPINHQRVIDAARLLNIPLMTAHTTTDNLVAAFLEKLMKRKRKDIELVGDILDILADVPEYREASKQKAGPRLFSGSRNRFAGLIAVTEITGGVEGSPEIYQRLAHAGVGTVIGMHMSEEHKKQAEQAHINAIVAGHMSSDSLGMNLFIDALERKGIAVVAFGGFHRVKRPAGAV